MTEAHPVLLVPSPIEAENLVRHLMPLCRKGFVPDISPFGMSTAEPFETGPAGIDLHLLGADVNTCPADTIFSYALRRLPAWRWLRNLNLRLNNP